MGTIILNKALSRIVSGKVLEIVEEGRSLVRILQRVV